MNTVSELPGLVDWLIASLNTIFGILVALAVFVIVWGLFKFIVHADDEEQRDIGRKRMLWGVIGLFLMFSVWGLVNILVNTLSFDQSPSAAPESRYEELQNNRGTYTGRGGDDPYEPPPPPDPPPPQPPHSEKYEKCPASDPFCDSVQR